MDKKVITKIVDKILKAQRENNKRKQYVNARLLEVIATFLREYNCEDIVIRVVKNVIKSLLEEKI